MSTSFVQNAAGFLLRSFDEFMYIRGQVMDSLPAELAGVVLHLAILAVSILLAVYWIYCGTVLWAAIGTELTAADMESMRWDRRLPASSLDDSASAEWTHS